NAVQLLRQAFDVGRAEDFGKCLRVRLAQAIHFRAVSAAVVTARTNVDHGVAAVNCAQAHDFRRGDFILSDGVHQRAAEPNFAVVKLHLLLLAWWSEWEGLPFDSPSIFNTLRDRVHA